jgi:sulfopyruvate decarboxylase TPP-binding subunit
METQIWVGNDKELINAAQQVTLYSIQEPHEEASIVSNATAALDTQERAQLTAIESMVW